MPPCSAVKCIHPTSAPRQACTSCPQLLWARCCTTHLCSRWPCSRRIVAAPLPAPIHAANHCLPAFRGSPLDLPPAHPSLLHSGPLMLLTTGRLSAS